MGSERGTKHRIGAIDFEWIGNYSVMDLVKALSRVVSLEFVNHNFVNIHNAS